uniref:DUF7950 domain-containing protein n=1 Tax=Nymphaea colorata TaxID=210225 RepID=A0A5K1BVB6_9MAGN
MVHPFDIVPAPSKAEQIMARYRPIAPKPQVSQPHNGDTSPITDNNLLPCLMGLPPASAQSLLISKPRRGRKRRTNFLASPRTKKAKIQLVGAASLPTITTLDLTLQGFHHNLAGFAFGNLGFVSKLKSPTTSPAPNFFNLSFLPFPSSIVPLHESVLTNLTDMASSNQNHKFEHAAAEEKDLLQKLQAPSSPGGTSHGQVIAPQPVKPVGSTISVRSICESDAGASAVPACKRPEEVEEEMESEALPAVVSDSNNRVRLANSAYKELVGQPECSWLDSMVAGHGKLRPAAKRISGEVMLLLADCPLPDSSNAFSCTVKIEWENNGQKGSTAAACNVTRLSCESKDYLFTWRFHVTSEACDASCK